MTKKYILMLFFISTIFALSADETSDAILDIKTNEILVSDKVYQNHALAADMWNEIIKEYKPDSIPVIEELIKKSALAIKTLDYAIELSNLLYQLQDQLITYYSEYEPDAFNLSTVNKNKRNSKLEERDIKQLKSDFIEKKESYQAILLSIITIDNKQKIAEEEIGKYSSIPSITDEYFRNEIYDYYTGGENKFIHTKPVILIFYNAEQDPSFDQLLHVEDIYDKYRDKINFYRVSYSNNSELISVFKVTELPTIYYLNLDFVLQKHVGTKGFYDIDEMIKNHILN